MYKLENLVKNLRKYLDASGLTREEFANKIGLSDTRIVYFYLSGKKTPSCDMFEKMVRVLGCTPEDLAC